MEPSDTGGGGHQRLGVGGRLPGDVSNNNEYNPDELTQLIDGIIGERLRLALEQNQQYVEVEAKRIQVERERSKVFWKKVRTWASFINNWSWAAVIVVGSFSTGIYIGLNLLPSGVVCPSESSSCYWLRIDGRKTAPK
ncbi:hypothetical protein [Crocosphaera subtropica]|uniref:hypothetical protein n=1 Tax=Crocosphaera subtropica TaxID=2546360 RepID=UPI0015F95183|nr:hypothetical protein [Crocosphaera subtropica]